LIKIPVFSAAAVAVAKKKNGFEQNGHFFHQVLDLTFTRAFFASCTASASPPSMSVAGSAKTKMRSSSTMTGS
jgi:hypothetical protein